LLRARFVPPTAQRQFRERTRQRRQRTHTRCDVSNRIQKVLEDANIKLAGVTTDVRSYTTPGFAPQLLGTITPQYFGVSPDDFLAFLACPWAGNSVLYVYTHQFSRSGQPVRRPVLLCGRGSNVWVLEPAPGRSERGVRGWERASPAGHHAPDHPAGDGHPAGGEGGARD
jgi:hypothetical protein